MTEHMEVVRPPANALLSYAELLNWIAFRQACEDDLIGCCCCDECDPALLKIFDCMSTGLQIWQPQPLWPDAPEWAMIGAPPPSIAVDIERADAIIARCKLSPAQLANEMRPKVELWQERSTIWRQALADLTEAIIANVLEPKTAPDTGAYAGRLSPGGMLSFSLRGLPSGWFAKTAVLDRWPVPTHPDPAKRRRPVDSATALRRVKDYVEAEIRSGRPIPKRAAMVASARSKFGLTAQETRDALSQLPKT